MAVLMLIAGIVVPTKPNQVEAPVGAPTKYTDYKIWYIKRDDNVHISEAGVRFFEGRIERKTVKGVQTDVYIRERKIPFEELSYLDSNKFRMETTGVKSVVYTPAEFGVITTDNQLRLYLNNQIAKDTGHLIVPELRETVNVNNVK